MSDSVLEGLVLEGTSKIVLLVLDGVGDLPDPAHEWRTPLEAARTPNLDRIVPAAALGRLLPVAPGITPGSGPGHLALFGYDPIATQVGRGVLEALGAGLELKPGDVAARANFCTVDGAGVVTDRRAGRIDTASSARLVEKLAQEAARIEDAGDPGARHGAIASSLFRGPGLGGGRATPTLTRKARRFPRRSLRAGGAGGRPHRERLVARARRCWRKIIRPTPRATRTFRAPKDPRLPQRFKLRAAVAGYLCTVASVSWPAWMYSRPGNPAEAFAVVRHWAAGLFAPSGGYGGRAAISTRAGSSGGRSRAARFARPQPTVPV